MYPMRKKLHKQHEMYMANASPNARGPNTIYTEDAGLPYFDRAAVIANGNWYYASALESMGAKLCFRYCLVNIGPSYR